MDKKQQNVGRKKVRAWMVLNEMSQSSIGDALGHKSKNQVHATLQGFRNDRRVLEYLLSAGCPAEFLDLPCDMLKAA